MDQSEAGVMPLKVAYFSRAGNCGGQPLVDRSAVGGSVWCVFTDDQSPQGVPSTAYAARDVTSVSI